MTMFGRLQFCLALILSPQWVWATKWGLDIPFEVDATVANTPNLSGAIDNFIASLQAKTCMPQPRRRQPLDATFWQFRDAGPTAPCWNIAEFNGIGAQVVNTNARCMAPLDPKSPVPPTDYLSPCDIAQLNAKYGCPTRSVVPPGCVVDTGSSNTQQQTTAACVSACEYGGTLRPLFRLFQNPLFNMNHMYTTDVAEKNAWLLSNDTTNEGVIGYLATTPQDPKCGCLIPLYRFVNKALNNHLYTTTRQEGADMLGYQFEKIEGYCAADKGCGAYTPLHRLWTPWHGTDDMLTTDGREFSMYRTNTALGYTPKTRAGQPYEPECYVWKSPIAADGCSENLNPVINTQIGSPFAGSFSPFRRRR